MGVLSAGLLEDIGVMINLGSLSINYFWQQGSENEEARQKIGSSLSGYGWCDIVIFI